jgi:flagellar basal body rod protein FlgG
VRYSRCVTILAIAACMAAGTVQRAHAQNETNPYDGTWKMDIAKTDFGKTAPPKSVTMTLTGTPTSKKWTIKSVAADGKSQTESYNGAVDDRFYPIIGDPDGATFAYMKDGSFATKDKSGKVVQTSTASLSPDGKTMTVHSIFHTPDGDVTRAAVFQKVK